MKLENLPRVAHDQSLGTDFAMGFAIICGVLGFVLVMFVYARYRKQQQGIMTKYVARGDGAFQRRNYR